MKSKSFDISHFTAVKRRQDRTFDFVDLYKSASETDASASERRQKTDNSNTERCTVKSESPKRERSPSKRTKKDKREPIDISQINIDGPVLSSSLGGSTPLNVSKVTSTPLGITKKSGKLSKVKSIMKNTSVADTDDAMDVSKLDTTSKPKKRNKSVSFMLDDNEAVVSKKTKSDDSTSDSKSASPKVKVDKIKRLYKKGKRNELSEKENTVDVNQTTGTDTSINKKSNQKSKIKPEKSKMIEVPLESTDDQQSTQNSNIVESKKKVKRVKKPKLPIKSTETKDITASETASLETSDKVKKVKKKKHQEKPDSEEPAVKTRKKDPKPDVIAADLENLSIGDNAHTLSNLLDEMTVVDKDKRKKLKQKFNKNKKPKEPAETENPENAEEKQEKVKWRRRKWNKDNKAEPKDASIENSIIVENLPLSLLFSYKKVLAEHFVKYGLIKSIGIAEVYPTEEATPLFTTTINFYSDGAAAQALEEDNTIFEGSRIRVKQALPPTETTLVVRSYGALTSQTLSSTFNSAGRIRNIRHLVKGKHAMATFFIEFDGPETVERAMKLATNIKIGGKKIYVSKFEVRVKKAKAQKTNENEGSDADHSDDSQD